MWEYRISVDKLGVSFIARKGKTRHEKSLAHTEAPKAIRQLLAKVSEDTKEQEFLYQAIKMFEAKEISILNK